MNRKHTSDYSQGSIINSQQMLCTVSKAPCCSITLFNVSPSRTIPKGQQQNSTNIPTHQVAHPCDNKTHLSLCRRTFIQITNKNPVPTSQRTQPDYITKSNRLTAVMKRLGIQCESKVKGKTASRSCSVLQHMVHIMTSALQTSNRPT